MHENRGASWQFEIFANFCRIIPLDMEVHTCDMGELCLIYACKSPSGQNPCPRFSSRNFPKFRIISSTRLLLMLVPDDLEHSGTDGFWNILVLDVLNCEYHMIWSMITE
jgi:hypothetical protein